MPRVIGGRYGLSSKEFTPGMVAGVFDELARERPRRRFTIGIIDDVSGTSLPYDADAGHRAARARSARSSSASARTARSARTRTRSRSSAPSRACTPRATSSTTRRSPARRRCRTCASGRSRSGRRTSSQQASFVGCHHFGLLDQVDVLGRAAPGATLLLNCPHAPDAGLGRAAPPGAGADPRQAHRRVRHRRRPGGPRGRAAPGAPTPCCRPASSPSPACCRARRRSPGSRRRSPRPTAGAAPRSSRATTPRSTARSAGCTGSTCPSGSRATRELPPIGARPRARVRAQRHRGDDGRPRRRAAGQRAAGGRHLPQRHHGVREAQHLRARRGLGLRPVHPVRQLQLRLPAQRDPVQVLRPVAAGAVRRTGSGRRR